MYINLSSLDIGILGENSIVYDIFKLVNETKGCLINLYGEYGSGKTELIKGISKYIGSKNTICFCEKENKSISEWFIEESEKLEEPIIFIDNVDQYYSREDFKNILLEIFKSPKQIKIIFTSNNKFFNENLLGINIYNFEVGNRNFSQDEYINFIKNNNQTSFIQDIQNTEFILKNSFLFAIYCKNFNYIFEVFAEIKSIIDKNHNSISPQQFIDILTKSELFSKLNRDLLIDTKNVENTEFMFIIRPKNKIEKLRDLIFKYYGEDGYLFEVLKSQFNVQIVDSNLKMDIPYEEKLLNICLTYDPIELLTKLLGPRDIIIELNDRKIGESSFAYSMVDKVKLILKDIGFNILNEPKGIEYFHDLFSKNIKIMSNNLIEGANKELILGLGMSCYQDMENIFFEMINFYSIYLCGSMKEFFNVYNSEGKNRIIQNRVTFGQYIGLFTFLNKLAKNEKYELKAIAIGRKELIPNKIIKLMEELSAYRSFFSHSQSIQMHEVQYSTFYKKSVMVYDKANEILNELIDKNIFPKIIKIKQIIFDEFGRHFFVGVDWNKVDIRFSLSYKLKDIDIYAHYYLLSKNNNRLMDPIIIPIVLDDNKDLLYNGENYQKSSQTQLMQGETLLDNFNVNNNMKILDVGCGNGNTTIQLFRKNETAIIDAFDLSESMIKVAKQNREAGNIQKSSINFYVEDAEKLDKVSYYDIVFSNATLHWITDSTGMYTKLYNALKTNGKLVVHQGGSNSYKGLQDAVKKAIEKLDYQSYYQNWSYPIFYPTKNEMHNLLLSIGFKNIKIISKETDGKEFTNLVDNYANAGMLPYINKLPDENMKSKLKNMYFQICKSENIDTYTHRLYIFAEKGEA